MMYNQKLAVAVKSNGKVLREHKDTVYVPFGTEYSLVIKNLNSVRALVKVWIDDTLVTDGIGGLIVGANSSIDLERFIKNGNLEDGNKFKFIERTQNISNHRGNKVDDGLIRVEFEFERPQQHAIDLKTAYEDLLRQKENEQWRKIGSAWPDIWCSTSSPVNVSSEPAVWYGAAHGRVANSNLSADASSRKLTPEIIAQAVSANEVGITVPGSHSTQRFTPAQSLQTDGVKRVMVIRMLGEVEGQAVMKPVTVNHKPKCVTCGKQNKATSKFCSECGTALSII